MRLNIPETVERVRHDLSGWLWHFCRWDNDPLETLRTILESGHTLGGKDHYRREVAVCLTETPLTELIRQSAVLEKRNYTRLSDYDIGFRKEWVFAKDGLPVIYQPACMRLQLPRDPLAALRS